MKRLVFLLFLPCFCCVSAADLLDEIVENTYRPQGLPLYEFAGDGTTCVVRADSATLVRRDFVTGVLVDTLVCLHKMPECPIKSIEGFRISPDERTVLLWTNSRPRYRRSFTADYFIYDIRRGKIEPLSQHGGEIELADYAPNGRYVAFVRAGNIFLKRLDYGTELAVTKDGEPGKCLNGVADWAYEEEFVRVKYFEWSADSKKIAYVKFDESAVPTYTFPLYNAPFSSDNPAVYTGQFAYKYPKTGQKNSKVSVHVYDDNHAVTRELTPGNTAEDFYIPRICWTADAEQLAVFRLDRRQKQLELYSVNCRSTVATLTLTQSDERYVDYQICDEIYFFSDGKHFILPSERDGARHLYLHRINGLVEKQLTSGAWDVTKFYGYDEKTGTLYYQSAEVSPLERHVYALDRRGKKRQITQTAGTHRARFNPQMTHFVLRSSSVDTPDRYVLMSAKGRELRTLRDNSALKDKARSAQLPRKEFISVPGAAGDELNAWVVKPANFSADSLYPLLIVQYNGPASQQVLNSWSIGWEYYLAENGYVVASVDTRGTGARGEDFRKCTSGQLGILETADVIAAARHLAKQPGIDPERLGIWGWSYGGYITLMAMSDAESPFRVGIAIAPVTDWLLYNSIYTERFMGLPQEHPAAYEASSALRRATDLKGKLLIVHSTADDNVHLQNTSLYVERLVESGKQFRMQVYTDKNHSILGTAARKHLYTCKSEFLFENL